MLRSSTTPRTRPPLSRGEVVAQVLTGVVVGAGAVYAAAVLRRGFVVALVVLLIGLAYLLRNRGRVRWVARGVLTSGLTALAAILAVLLAGHDIL
jgi:hypothetical protein